MIQFHTPEGGHTRSIELIAVNHLLLSTLMPAFSSVRRVNSWFHCKQSLQALPDKTETVLCVVLVTDSTHPGGDIGGGEAVGRGRQGDDGLDDRAHAGLVEIDTADDGFADLCSGRELFEHVIGDEALIDAAQGVGKLYCTTQRLAICKCQRFVFLSPFAVMIRTGSRALRMTTT